MKLRIIAGKFKGRLISVPKNKLIRPTSDRVRETLFNVLINKINFEGINVLDLYAGSGAFGLESLSRGAKEIYFVEKNFTVCKNLNENIKSLNSEESCKTFKMDTLKFVENEIDVKFNLIFADPPYFKSNIYEVIKKLRKNDLIAINGIIIIERSIRTKTEDIKEFNTEPLKIIGDTCLYKLKL